MTNHRSDAPRRDLELLRRLAEMIGASLRDEGTRWTLALSPGLLRGPVERGAHCMLEYQGRTTTLGDLSDRELCWVAVLHSAFRQRRLLPLLQQAWQRWWHVRTKYAELLRTDAERDALLAVVELELYHRLDVQFGRRALRAVTAPDALARAARLLDDLRAAWAGGARAMRPPEPASESPQFELLRDLGLELPASGGATVTLVRTTQGVQVAVGRHGPPLTLDTRSPDPDEAAALLAMIACWRLLPYLKLTADALHAARRMLVSALLPEGCGDGEYDRLSVHDLRSPLSAEPVAQALVAAARHPCSCCVPFVLPPACGPIELVVRASQEYAVWHQPEPKFEGEHELLVLHESGPRRLPLQLV